MLGRKEAENSHKEHKERKKEGFKRRDILFLLALSLIGVAIADKDKSYSCRRLRP